MDASKQIEETKKPSDKKELHETKKKVKTKCVFQGCEREALAKNLCWTHYQQSRRGRPLTPIRQRGLTLLPGNVRVTKDIAEVLYKRITDGQSRSVYEATRHAVEAGIKCWADHKKA